MKTVAIIGAGQRGQDIYGEFIKNNSNLAKVVAVVEPNDFRREKMRKEHNISIENTFSNMEEFFKREKLADVVIISTLDREHYEPVMNALDKGYNVLLEKPMSINKDECVKMVDKAEEKGALLMVCHVLRYTSFFRKLKELIDSGEIGDIVTIQHNENVGAFHMAHSFVRGNWRNSDETSPIILQKSCHDLDILSWLIGSKCISVASFGELSFFNSKNKPTDAADRCVNCIVNDCVFDGRKVYLDVIGKWPATVVSNKQTREGILESLSKNNYGRCVFDCDNNVCDHQSTILKFENGVTATFNLSGFTDEISRTIKIMGTKGEIRGHEGRNEIEVIKFRSNFNEKKKKKLYKIEKSTSGHNGGDGGLMCELFKLLENGDKDSLSSGRKSLESHLMAFAAEESRIKNKVINL
ncbi:Gfo/Idh/MocA family oxidoreductase [Clostridioides difficile]